MLGIKWKFWSMYFNSVYFKWNIFRSRKFCSMPHGLSFDPQEPIVLNEKVTQFHNKNNVTLIDDSGQLSLFCSRTSKLWLVFIVLISVNECNFSCWKPFISQYDMSLWFQSNSWKYMFLQKIIMVLLSNIYTNRNE